MSRDKQAACHCPYCDGPVADDAELCTPCTVTVAVCPDCGKPLPRGRKTCPECEGRAKPGQGRNAK
jgi:hypothetical protein